MNFFAPKLIVEREIILRDYQEIASNALFGYLEKNTGYPVVAMPTGTGKSVVIGDVVKKILRWWPNRRVFMLTHVMELIQQNAEKMSRIWPQAPIGIYSAGVGVKETHMPITFGGVASVVKALEKFPVPDMLIVDECHLISPNANSMYQTIIAYWKERNPYLVVVGFTATWWRQGQGSLLADYERVEGDKKVFTDIAINMTDMESFNWFIDQGYLVPLIARPLETQIDVSSVGISKGEYNLGQLADATMRVTWGALNEAMSYAQDRKKWLVFCAGKENSEQAADILNALGISATFVHDGVSKADRASRLEGFKSGYYRAICNNNILTTGFDVPGIDCIIMLRKTLSAGLWVQMLGRGTRPDYHPHYADQLMYREIRQAAIYYSDKRNCLVLDYARNTAELGPINDPRVPHTKGKGTGEAPVKICPSCGSYQHASVRRCDGCGYEFPKNSGIFRTSSADQLIRTVAPEYDWFDVQSILYREWIAKGSGKSLLRVTYQATQNGGLVSKFFDEWICIEHQGFPLHKAKLWWAARVPDPRHPMPATVKEALTYQPMFRKPTKIRVWTNKTNPEIMNYEYE